jgi:hypothetical protein
MVAWSAVLGNQGKQKTFLQITVIYRFLSWQTYIFINDALDIIVGFQRGSSYP